MPAHYVEFDDEAAVRAYAQTLSLDRERRLSAGLPLPDYPALMASEAQRIATRKRLSRLGCDPDYDEAT